MGFPTLEKIQKTLKSYNEHAHHFMGAYSEENLVGIVGLHIHETHGIIKHIAILESYQKQGIGKALITEVIKHFQLITCEVETDEEGRGFYEKCGFTCSPFEGKYNTRYRGKWGKVVNNLSEYSLT